MITFQASSKFLLNHALFILLAAVFCTAALAGGPKKPQIPKVDFEWTGTFLGNQPFQGDSNDLDQPKEMEQLTVRGKWQTGEDGNEYFNLYMEQGDVNGNTWVQNFIYEDKLYTMTRKWHTELPDLLPGASLVGMCIQNEIYNSDDPWNPLSITVDGLNIGLTSSRLVGVEIIDGEPMNHFRHTCLAHASPQLLLPLLPFDPADKDNPLAIPFRAFSDIYVPVGESYPWTKWLQYGDGVGPDPHQDEWFLANKFDNVPADIILPEACKAGNEWIKDEGLKTLIVTYQTTCTNLVPAATIIQPPIFSDGFEEQ